MEGKQKIHCTVGTCVYNNQEQNMCVLEAIQVTPVQNTQTKMQDESMCASYEYEKE